MPARLLVLSSLALVALATDPAFARRKFEPCDPGRYFVVGEPLVPTPGDPSDDGTDVILYGQQIGVEDECDAVRPAQRKGTSNGTKIKTTWRSCDGLVGTVRMTAKTDPTCTTMTGVFRAKKSKLRRDFQAELSRCGDGRFDPEVEDCEGTAGCSGCTAECTCPDPLPNPTTSTSTSTSTTTTTVTTTTTTSTAATTSIPATTTTTSTLPSSTSLPTTSTTTTVTTTSSTTITVLNGPDLIPTAYTASAPTVVSGQQMTVSWTVKNQGNQSANGGWYDQVLLSTDQFASANDVQLLNPFHSGPLAANATYSMNGQAITIPSTQPAGEYYLLFRTDVYAGVAESDEVNNAWSPALPLTVQTPDLLPTAFTASTASIVSGQQMTVSWTVKNQGTGTAFGGWYDQVFLSTDPFISANDVSLANPFRSGPLAVDATYSVNGQVVTIPSTQPAGDYYLLFRSDVYASLFENGQDANNEWGMPIPITVYVPDLVPTAFTASTSTIVSGQQMTVSWTVKNQGSGTAFGGWYDQVFLSTDPFISANDVSLANPFRSGPLAVNATYSVNGLVVTIPSTQPPGDYYLLFRTDVYASLFEDGLDANNEWAMPLTVMVFSPDLVPTAFSASTANIVSGQQMTVSWTVKNQGGGTAFGGWYDQVFLSTDQFISANDVSLANPFRSGPLAVDATYSVNGQLVTIPSSQPAGSYYLLFRTDVYASLFENGLDANNEWGMPIPLTVQVPDLVPTAFTASTQTITKGSQMTVSWTVENQGGGTAFGGWYDQVFLSTDQFISANDVSLANPFRSGPLAVDATYSVNGQSITIPANTTPGAYYLLFRTDVYASLFEDGLDANNEWGTPRPLTVN
jgi:hypothetical protein